MFTKLHMPSTTMKSGKFGCIFLVSVVMFWWVETSLLLVESFVIGPIHTSYGHCPTSPTGRWATDSSVEAPNRALFNFGAASARDNVLFTAERPGNPAITKTGLADPDRVQEWITFMVDQQGIRNVIALLDENELANYGEPGRLLKLYQEAGIKCLAQPMNGPNACQNIIEFVRQAESNNEKVVAHCTGGIGRAGRVAACWLMKR